MAKKPAYKARKCESCSGPGLILWDGKTKRYSCDKCHSEPGDPFFVQMRQWVKPDGTYTKDSNEYGDAWQALANKAVSFFPGYAYAASNPGIVLQLRETDSDGRYRVVDEIRLSVEAVNRLVCPRGE